MGSPGDDDGAHPGVAVSSGQAHRVASKNFVVIRPHDGWISRAFTKTWTTRLIKLISLCIMFQKRKTFPNIYYYEKDHSINHEHKFVGIFEPSSSVREHFCDQFR